MDLNVKKSAKIDRDTVTEPRLKPQFWIKKKKKTAKNSKNQIRDSTLNSFSSKPLKKKIMLMIAKITCVHCEWLLSKTDEKPIRPKCER